MSMVDKQTIKDIDNAIQSLAQLKNENKLSVKEEKKEACPTKELQDIPISLEDTGLHICHEKVKETPKDFVLEKNDPRVLVV